MVPVGKALTRCALHTVGACVHGGGGTCMHACVCVRACGCQWTHAPESTHHKSQRDTIVAYKYFSV